MSKGVVDRIEDNEHTVIIFESENKQIVCHPEELPKKARHSGAVIEADISKDNISNIDYLPEEEKSNTERVKRKRDRLTDDN